MIEKSNEPSLLPPHPQKKRGGGNTKKHVFHCINSRTKPHHHHLSDGVFFFFFTQVLRNQRTKSSLTVPPTPHEPLEVAQTEPHEEKKKKVTQTLRKM